MARGAAACFRLDEIRGVTVNVDAHAASMEPDDGIQLRGRVFHDHFCLLDGVSGWKILLGAYFVERDKHREVNSTRNIEEGAGDTLQACDAAFIMFWCGCGVWGVLYFGSVSWREPFVGRVFGGVGAWGAGTPPGLCGNSWAWRCQRTCRGSSI